LFLFSQVTGTTESLDVESDLRDFIYSTYNGSTPSHVRLQPREAPDLAKHIGLNAYETSVSYLTRAQNTISAIGKFLEDLNLADEEEAKGLKRYNWLNQNAQTLPLCCVSITLEEFRKLLEGFTSGLERRATHIREMVVGPLQVCLDKTERITFVVFLFFINYYFLFIFYFLFFVFYFLFFIVDF
jgi:hypothetical protein